MERFLVFKVQFEMPNDLAVGDGTLEIIRIVRLLDIKESQKARKIEQIT